MSDSEASSLELLRSAMNNSQKAFAFSRAKAFLFPPKVRATSLQRNTERSTRKLGREPSNLSTQP